MTYCKVDRCDQRENRTIFTFLFLCLAESGFSFDYLVENNGFNRGRFSVIFFFVFTKNVFPSPSCCLFLWKYSVETGDLSHYSRPVAAVEQTFL